MFNSFELLRKNPENQQLAKKVGGKYTAHLYEKLQAFTKTLVSAIEKHVSIGVE